MEPQWNPMAEAQAIDRVHRIGQQQDVAIHRYIVRNSIESVYYVAVATICLELTLITVRADYSGTKVGSNSKFFVN